MDPAIISTDYTQAPALEAAVKLTEYDEIAEILKSRKFVQSGYRVNKDTLMKNVLITLEGEPHMKRRRVLARMFDDEAIASLRDRHLKPQIDRCLAEVSALPKSADGRIRTDLIPLLNRTLYRTAAAIAGIDGLEGAAVADHFIEVINAISAGLVVDWAQKDAERIMRQGEEARETFRGEMFNPSYARRKALVDAARAQGKLNAAELPHDTMTLMLCHRDEAWQGDDDLLLRETYVFLSASTATTANAFVWFTLRFEDWLQRHPEDRSLITGDPEFLRRAVFDSLRMTVSAPWRMRTATEDVTLASGRRIKAGQDVALLFIPADTQENRFGPDAKEFNPHRRVEGGLAPWGHAFGGGAHTCLGRPLVTGSRNPAGDTTVDGTLVSLARRFYAAGLELDPDSPPVREAGTYFQVYSSVPIRFSSGT